MDIHVDFDPATNKAIKATVDGTILVPQVIPPVVVPTFGDRLGFSPGAAIVTGGHDVLADIAVIKKAGATWVRLDCFDNGNLTVDTAVRQSIASGLKILLIINSNFKNGAGAYASTCTTVVGRYSPMGVHTYELVNEPNGMERNPANPTGPAIPRLAASLYVALLPMAIAAVRAADPSAKILCGALAPSHEPTDAISEPGFTAYGKAIIDSGAKYDVLSVHPYSIPNLPVSQPDPTWQSWTKMIGLQKYAISKGDLRPIWATEFGGLIGAGGWTDSSEVTGFNEAVTFMKSYPWLEKLFWYCVRDGTQGDRTFGVVRVDNTERPVLAAMTLATK